MGAAAWKELDVEVRAVYQQKYVRARASYDEELAAFIAAGGVKEKCASAMCFEKRKVNGPKKVRGAFELWIGKNRLTLTEQIMQKHQVDKAAAFYKVYDEGKLIYEALPAAEKEEYRIKAEKAKLKYKAEYKEWKEENRGKNNFVIQFPKKPVGAYKHWLASNRSVAIEYVMAAAGVDKKKANRMLFRGAKVLYNGLPVLEKKRYEEIAEAQKIEYRAEYKKWTEHRRETVKDYKRSERVSLRPKRPLSAYVQWIQDNRGMLINEIMAKLGVNNSMAYKLCYKEAKPFYDALPELEKKK